jgi:hypothetical protein
MVIAFFSLIKLTFLEAVPRKPHAQSTSPLVQTHFNSQERQKHTFTLLLILGAFRINHLTSVPCFVNFRHLLWPVPLPFF